MTCFFWFALQLPPSQQKEMTAEKVNAKLHTELLASTNRKGYLFHQTDYKLDPESIVLLGKCLLS